MSNNDIDLALQTLIAVRTEVAPQLDEELLLQCYAVQKKYQFSDDRSMSTSAMERLIDAKVAQSSNLARDRA
jgi:hypothetical protein